MTHCFGFSIFLYDTYVGGSPLKTVNGSQYLDSPQIQRELKRQYDCDNAPGMLLQTSVGSNGTDGSHWARKAFGNEYMTATVSFNNPTISHITMALLETTGWYVRINHQFAKFVNFGRHSGCRMLDPSDCEPAEYCDTLKERGCDFDYVAGSFCGTDALSSKCAYRKIFNNFLCANVSYSSQVTAGEQSGYRSKCFYSTLRSDGEK